jgi:hypothetical protein
MIYFNVNIRNPRWWDRFKPIKTWVGSTFLEHKFWEIQISKSCELLRLEFSWTVQEDHAGIRLELGLLGYQIDFNIYDHRHWDTDTNTWQN